jgi:hypothetical protein
MSVSPVSGGATGELIQIGARTTRSTDLSIVTAQGDKVTISASATHGVGYAAATGSSDGVSVSDSSSLSISVEGDLNRRELHDINKVVRALDRAAARGDASRLLDRLSHAHLRSLSTISGSITTQTVVTAQQIQGSQQPSDPADSAPPASLDTSTAPSGSSTPAPVAESASSSTADAAATTDAPAPAAPASQTPTTLKAPVVQKTTAAGAPGVPPPRAPKIEDFMFTILKALLNPNSGTASGAPAAASSTSTADTSDELKAA